MHNVFYLVIEDARSWAEPDFYAIFLHVVLNPLDNVFLDQALVFEASDLNVGSLVLVESIFNHDNDWFLSGVDDYASFDVAMDFAGVDQNICVFDKESYGRVDWISSDEAVFEDSLRSWLQNHRRNRWLDVPLEKIKT